MRVPPRVGSSSGISVKSGFRWTCGTCGVQQAAEALDEAVDLDPALVGAHHRALDGGVQGRRVAARRQDADPLHPRLPLPKSPSFYCVAPSGGRSRYKAVANVPVRARVLTATPCRGAAPGRRPADDGQERRPAAGSLHERLARRGVAGVEDLDLGRGSFSRAARRRRYSGLRPVLLGAAHTHDDARWVAPRLQLQAVGGLSAAVSGRPTLHVLKPIHLGKGADAGSVSSRRSNWTAGQSRAQATRAIIRVGSHGPRCRARPRTCPVKRLSAIATRTRPGIVDAKI